jgi:hypothetical protein
MEEQLYELSPPPKVLFTQPLSAIPELNCQVILSPGAYPYASCKVILIPVPDDCALLNFPSIFDLPSCEKFWPSTI